MRHISSPVIIIGMHRSGTSLITSILKDLGLFIGFEIDQNYESRFFQERNIEILNALNGSYLHPHVFTEINTDIIVENMFINYLKKDLSSIHCSRYLGSHYYLKYRSLFNLDITWGWKDPRNTFTLNFWMKLFPGAKILHVIRNGVDVAASLEHRDKYVETSHLEESDNGTNTNFIKTQSKALKEKGLVLFLVYKLYRLGNKLNPLHKYQAVNINPAVNIEEGYRLWEQYLVRAFQYQEMYPENFLNVKYEEFINDPENQIQTIREFCNLPTPNSDLNHLVSKINSKRRYAFLNNERLISLYEKVKDDFWMKKLQYDEISFKFSRSPLV